MNNELRDAVVAEAKTWLNTPYRHYAKIKGVGVDCAMILVDVYFRVGLLPEIDPRPYAHDWHLHRSEEKYLNWVTKFCDKVEVGLPGDLALYKFGRCISHGAIVIKWPIILHSYITDGCVMAEGDRGALENRLSGFYRFRGIE